MKKFVCALITVMVIGFSLVAVPSLSHAKEITSTEKTLSKEKVNQKLLKLGLSLEEISQMKDDLKLDIVNNHSIKKLISHKKVNKNMENDLNKSTQQGDIISPMTLTQSDMSLDTYTFDLGTYSGEPAFEIYASYDWNTHPFFTLTDGLAIAYDKGWTSYGYGFHGTWRHQVCNEDVSCTWTSSSVSGSLTDSDPDGGYAWLYDIKSGTGGDYDNYGYAYVKVRAEHDYTYHPGDADGYSRYMHDEDLGNLSVSVTPGGKYGSLASISYSGTNEILTDPVQW